MPPPPFDQGDWFEAESDSDGSISDIEEVDTQGVRSKVGDGAHWEDEFGNESQQVDSEDNKSQSDGQVEEDQPIEDVTVPTLLPIPASIKKPDQSLCMVCQKLELTPRRFVVLPGDPETGKEVDNPDIDLGFLRDIKTKAAQCPFCRLVLTALGPEVPVVGEDGSLVTVTMTWNTDKVYGRSPNIRILRPYAQTKEGGYVNGTNLFPEITMVANDAPASAKKTQLVRIVNDQIDFGMVRNWLNICRVRHGGACDESKMMDFKVKDPAKHIPHFRLIDVVDNCIIPAPHGSKYVALSYVWGRIDPNDILRSLLSTYKELEQPGALSLPENHDRIPITIQDAIQVVRELKLRYLWVDSLCIIQDDIGPGGSKMSAISKMDLVYGAAYLTIWAATGNDANAGLPGVRPNSRGVSQPIEEISPELRLAFKQRSEDYASKEVYYTRAWTFQEQQYTKRNLLFIGGQVAFNCAKGSQWREDVLFENGELEETERRPKNRDDIGDFEGLILTYTLLSLTYETDIYHAFAGFNNYFKKYLRVDLIHGIPDAYFDWFLLWDPSHGQRRRDKAPSWSWSGWIGQSVPRIWDWYTPSIARIRKAIRTRTWIIWYQRKAHDSEEVMRVWTPKESPRPKSKPRNLYGSHVKNRFEIDCRKTVPTPRKLLDAPQYIEDTHCPKPGSGFLQFWTVSLVFRLGEPTSKEHDGAFKALTRLGIYGQSNRELGVIYLQPEWASGNIEKDHEFVVLCEARDKKAKSRKQPDGAEDEWRYRVMLIEWKGDWAERVSIGSIGKGDPNESLNEPLWKEIILG